jgi:alkylhydroperoxidase/carboxymuconolactone decarboxylase family protein YurZ
MQSVEATFTFIAQQNPAFAGSFQALFESVYTQTNANLDRKTRILIYLTVLASLGAEESFTSHLKDAEHAGISQAEVLDAILTAVPAVGITPILRAASALKLHSHK